MAFCLVRFIDQLNRCFSAGTETGYYKIKQQKDWTKYPYVEQNGACYLSAASLRQLDLIWWPKELHLFVFALNLLGKKTKMFNKYEQPEDGAANSIRWRSSFNYLATFDGPGIRYYTILIASFKANILPMLEDNLQIVIEEFFGSFMYVLLACVYYMDSDWQLLSNHLDSMNATLEGPLVFIMKYGSMVLKTDNFQMNQEELISLGFLCERLGKYAKEKPINLQVNEGERKAKNGWFDVVPAVSCDGFPLAASQWPDRVSSKEWPSYQVVQEIIHAGEFLSFASKSGF